MPKVIYYQKSTKRNKERVKQKLILWCKILNVRSLITDQIQSDILLHSTKFIFLGWFCKMEDFVVVSELLFNYCLMFMYYFFTLI